MQFPRLCLRQLPLNWKGSGDNMAVTQPLNNETVLDYVDPDLLDFDPSNPRFGGLMSGYKQPAIQRALFSEPYYASELVDSLLANGFIDYEPLVVKRKGTRFTVVEGNRRLAAIKEIRENPSKYKVRIIRLIH